MTPARPYRVQVLGSEIQGEKDQCRLLSSPSTAHSPHTGALKVLAPDHDIRSSIAGTWLQNFNTSPGDFKMSQS